MLKRVALTSLLLTMTGPTTFAAEPSPDAVVQKQVEAYNAHNLDAFLACYAPTIEFRTLDGNVNPERGIPAMRKAYEEIFKQFPKLKTTVLKRIIQGTFVIDQQLAEGMGPKPLTITAIYQVENGKIARVWYIEG